MTFNVVPPLVAKSTPHVGALELGWLTVAMGFGSLLAPLEVAHLGRNPNPRVVLAALLVAPGPWRATARPGRSPGG